MPEPPKRGEALVAIMNDERDWGIVQEQGWYRIPIEKTPKRWPPKWLAFYQTKVFGEEAFAVNYFGRVKAIEGAVRRDLFPDEKPGPKSNREYHIVRIEGLERLPAPVISKRLRLIIFIPTTLRKLLTAGEINDLFDDSPLEDTLWKELKKQSLFAERQYYLQRGARWYALDFALFCNKGNLNVEADGDLWHNLPGRVPEDNVRNNDLAALGYQVLRFNGMHIREKLTDYCVPQITDTVNRLGGLKDPQEPSRAYTQTTDGIVSQLGLFPGK
jgi:very-short-patch-repair endonuclease